jgi:hypothetical protein
MVRAVAVLVVAVALLLPPSAPATGVKDLFGWASSSGLPPVAMSALRWNGRPLTRVKPGTYLLHLKVTDGSVFHLVGPGVDRKATAPQSGATVYTNWKIRLRIGRYRYSAEGGWAAGLRANGLATSGSFVVR